jgi:hypothetical protein
VRPPTQEDAPRNFRLLRIDRLAARFTRPEQGAVAVEFSLVILLFITIVPENPDRRRFGLFRRPAGGEREHDPG